MVAIGVATSLPFSLETNLFNGCLTRIRDYENAIFVIRNIVIV